MKRSLLLTVFLVGITLIFSACGGESPDQGSKETGTSKAAPNKEEGIAVAKEILETFDKAVAEAAELAKTKPDAAELKPKLEALYKKYEDTMKKINVKYLALKDKDIVLFGAANGYLGENRGKHVFKSSELMYSHASYYNSRGEQEIGRFLSKEFIKLLDLAVQR